MNKLSSFFNSAGLGVSFFCFLHCILVILVFSGLLQANLVILEIFENPINHALLVITGVSLAALSLIKFNFNDHSQAIGRSQALKMNDLLSIQFIVGASLLGLSFLFDGIYSEILVVFGALTLFSMHAKKLLKAN
jgi:hypothetical protein